MSGRIINRLILVLFLASPVLAQDAPYVDSKIAKERFKDITAADMDALRGKKILLASRSFGLNLCNGFRSLAKEDKKFEMLSSFERFNIPQNGFDSVKADAFASKNFVHVLATYWPHTKRMEEVDTYLRKPPHEFGKQVDIVIVFFHTALPDNFDNYADTMDAWVKDFPKTRFIYVTAGFMGPKYAAKENENAHAWSEKVRARYQGKQPLYDLGKILSDDFRVGHIYAPEYSKDPADVHPSSDEGQQMMAKGMLVLLTETLKWKPGAAPATVAGGSTTQPAAATEKLAPSHPDYKAVQAILTANGLTKKKVEAVSVVENGRVTKLYLQEGGVKTIPDAIGQLTELRLLHCYGDRDLKLPLLTKVSPAIGKCTKLEELLLNQNDLPTLPAEIAQLTALTQLSIADNKLKDLPPAVKAWAEKFDAKGLGDQKP